MSQHLTGIVVEVGETQQLTESFKKRDLIVEYTQKPEWSPEPLKFEAMNATCEKLDELRAGDNVKVYFNLKGRPGKPKDGKNTYYNTLQLHKFDILRTAPAAPINGYYNHNAAPDDDDLPF